MGLVENIQSSVTYQLQPRAMNLTLKVNIV